MWLMQIYMVSHCLQINSIVKSHDEKLVIKLKIHHSFQILCQGFIWNSFDSQNMSLKQICFNMLYMIYE